MTDFFNIVGSFGFPVAVASYLLFRFEKKLEQLTEVNKSLVIEIKELKRVNANFIKEVKDLKNRIIELEMCIKTKNKI